MLTLNTSPSVMMFAVSFVSIEVMSAAGEG
jgi:hypothetical protein